MARDESPNSQDTTNATIPNYPREIPFWRLMTDQHVITQDILDHKYPGSGSEDDPYVVSWIPEDPRNPMNFSMARKVIIVFVTGFSALIISLASSGYSGSMKYIIQHFNVSEEVATLGLSLFVMGFSIGPLLWAPLSENIGRQVPFFYLISTHGGLLCRMCRSAKHSDAFNPTLLCWSIWLIAPYECWRDCLRYVHVAAAGTCTSSICSDSVYRYIPAPIVILDSRCTNSRTRSRHRPHDRWISRNERRLAVG